MTDTEILDWINANPIIQFSHHENKHFGPHWRVVFGPKSAENRHTDFRSVVRYAKELAQQQENNSVVNADEEIWGKIADHIVGNHLI